MLRSSLQSLSRLGPAALCSVALTACGGGGGGDAANAAAEPTATALTEIPAVAIQSVTGLVDYQRTVRSTSTEAQDRAEPLDVSTLTLPTSETAEPSDV